MIIPVYKPLGTSTHQLAKKLGLLYQTKATHTGTLDPLAEGVVVILTDQDRFNKVELSNTQKKYFVEIVVGFSTDTDDLLGLVTDSKKSQENIFSLFSDQANKLIGEHTQMIHPFSAKRINGSSYFSLSKHGVSPPNAQEKIEIQAFVALNQGKISVKNFHENIKRKISLVKGDFRQTEVLQQWHTTLLHFSPSTELITITCEITCSKRTYIRSLIRHLSTKLHQPMVINQLIRIKNGPYSITDCICLI